MSGVVLDASAALSILTVSQETAKSRAFAKQLPAPLWAPALFPVEVRYAILKLERRSLIAPHALEPSLAALDSAIEAFAPLNLADMPRLMRIAREERIGLFDALYLVLAQDRDAALASRDGPLLAAAQRLGVEIIDLR